MTEPTQSQTMDEVFAEYYEKGWKAGCDLTNLTLRALREQVPANEVVALAAIGQMLSELERTENASVPEGWHDSAKGAPMSDLRKLHEAATPGPWASGGDEVYAGSGATYSEIGRIYENDDATRQSDNATFIAGWRNAAPLILDVLDAARAVVKSPIYEQPHIARSEGGEGWISVEYAAAGGVLVAALAALDAHLEASKP